MKKTENTAIFGMKRGRDFFGIRKEGNNEENPVIMEKKKFCSNSH